LTGKEFSVSTEKAAAQINPEEAQGRLRAFEVGVGHLCQQLGVEYDAFAKMANAQVEQAGFSKIAASDEEAPANLAPWLIDRIVEAAETTDGK
jgi:hypothetical protein